MLSEKAANNLKYFSLCAPLRFKNPRSWIKFSVGMMQSSGLNAPDEIVDQLIKHLDDFFCIEKIHDNLDLGGRYGCETVLDGKITKWCFKFSDGSPYQACLTLSLIEEGGDKKWLPPQA